MLSAYAWSFQMVPWNTGMVSSGRCTKVSYSYRIWKLEKKTQLLSAESIYISGFIERGLHVSSHSKRDRADF